MSKITADMVKTLRERTGVGMSKCKEALDESAGDMEKAIEYLRKKGMATAVKKGGREANEGLVGSCENDEAVVLLELNAETDFVVQNEKFKNFLDVLCKEALKSNPNDVESFMKQPLSGRPGISIEEARAELVLSLGENILVKRLEVIKKQAGSSYGVYSHMGGKIVVMIELGGDTDQGPLAKDIAMHTAAEAPEYLRPADVPEDIVAREKDIAKTQIGKKPENVIDKILEGKMKSFYEQTCLVCQKFVKDQSITVEKLLEEASSKTSQPLTITRFARWQVGAA